jgi:hypothetical protein
LEGSCRDLNEVLSQHRSRDMEEIYKNSVRVTDDPGEVQSQHLPNTSSVTSRPTRSVISSYDLKRKQHNIRSQRIKCGDIPKLDENYILIMLLLL